MPHNWHQGWPDVQYCTSKGLWLGSVVRVLKGVSSWVGTASSLMRRSEVMSSMMGRASAIFISRFSPLCLRDAITLHTGAPAEASQQPQLTLLPPFSCMPLCGTTHVQCGRRHA